MKQQNHYVNKLKHPNESGEIDLCADIIEQPMAVLAYERDINSYCPNCNTEPCRCHLIHLI